MQIICGKCQRKFKLDDEKIPAGGVKVRCSKCGFTFQVQKPAGAPAPESEASEPKAPPAVKAPPKPAPAAPIKAAPPEDEFSDIFSGPGSAPAASGQESEFQDLFSGGEKTGAAEGGPEDAFADIFETSAPDEPAAPPVPPRAPEPPRAPGPARVPEPKPVREMESLDSLGQEFSLDEADDYLKGGPPGGAAGPQPSSLKPAPAEPAQTATKEEGPEWGAIKFGEGADEEPQLELDKKETAEAPPAAEKPKPAPAARPAGAPAEPKKAISLPVAEKHKVRPVLEETPSYIIHTSFIVLMLLVLIGTGTRFILQNPSLLKKAGLGTMADGIFYREITKQQQVVPFQTETYWMKNLEQIPILVIEGRLFNGTGRLLDLFGLSVSLFKPDGKPLSTQTVPIEAPVAVEEIRNLSLAELQARMTQSSLGIKLPPNGELAFRIPVPGIAPQKITYRIGVQ